MENQKAPEMVVTRHCESLRVLGFSVATAMSALAALIGIVGVNLARRMVLQGSDPSLIVLFGVAILALALFNAVLGVVFGRMLCRATNHRRPAYTARRYLFIPALFVPLLIPVLLMRRRDRPSSPSDVFGYLEVGGSVVLGLVVALAIGALVGWGVVRRTRLPAIAPNSQAEVH